MAQGRGIDLRLAVQGHSGPGRRAVLIAGRRLIDEVEGGRTRTRVMPTRVVALGELVGETIVDAGAWFGTDSGYYLQIECGGCYSEVVETDRRTT